MPSATVTVIGATGLIGSHLVKLLQLDPQIENIRVIVRRPVQFNESKVEVKLVNFADKESFKMAIDGSDGVFCTVGTTQKKVRGDKDAYRKVDYDIAVNAAKYCAATGCERFVLVSSVGADSKSSNFYLKLKGEVEDAVSAQSIKCISIFRPSMLLGERKENRPGERIGQTVMKNLSFLLAGNWRKYKPIHAKEVAVAMLRSYKTNQPGIHVYEYDQLKL